MTELEQQFHKAMIGVYEQAKRDCNYNATYFLRMVADLGAIETARRLLASTTPSDGFTSLWMCGRMDLTMEAQIIRPEFAGLFTAEEIAKARDRLAEYGYNTDT